MTLDKNILLQQLEELFPDNNQGLITPQRVRNYFTNVLDSVQLSSTVPVTNELFVNVKNYGAVGDGGTDDSQAFADALATGRNIYVPEGIYSIDKTLIIEASIQMIGAGINNTTLLFEDTTYGDDSCFYINENAVISNLTLRQAETESEKNCLIKIANDNITIEKVMFNSAVIAIAVQYQGGTTLTPFTLKDCIFSNNKVAVLIISDNQCPVKMDNCFFDNNILSLDLESFNVSISNCLFKGVSLIQLKNVTEAHTYLEFSKCFFSGDPVKSSIISSISNTSFALLFNECKLIDASLSMPDNILLVSFSKCQLNGVRFIDSCNEMNIKISECLIENTDTTNGSKYTITSNDNIKIIDDKYKFE